MKKIVALYIVLLISFACSRVPISGRKQLNMLPESTLMSMSFSNYRSFIASNAVMPPHDPQAQMVKRVGERISKAVDAFMRQKKLSKRIRGFKWEFNLVNDRLVNAWCMPGGKVVVYTGLLPVAQDETGLAVVMGHEIAHAIARHGNERMSQQLVALMGGVGLAVAMRDKPKETQDIFMASYGVGSALGILKYSRVHETEADKLGLVFMAMAGYRPEAAIGFWERMSQMSGGPKPPEIISTHPSDETRIRNIRAFLPTANKYYKST